MPRRVCGVPWVSLQFDSLPLVVVLVQIVLCAEKQDVTHMHNIKLLVLTLYYLRSPLKFVLTASERGLG